MKGKPVDLATHLAKGRRMSTEHTLHMDETTELVVEESSDMVRIGAHCKVADQAVYTDSMTEEEFRAVIVKQIKILSYISADPDEVLKRFNVEYGQTK